MPCEVHVGQQAHAQGGLGDGQEQLDAVLVVEGMGWMCPAEMATTMGIIAASTVHWLMLDETMFMRAMGAPVIFRAQ